MSTECITLCEVGPTSKSFGQFRSSAEVPSHWFDAALHTHSAAICVNQFLISGIVPSCPGASTCRVASRRDRNSGRIRARDAGGRMPLLGQDDDVAVP